MPTPQSDKILIYTHLGKRYKAPIGYTDLNELSALIHEKNPTCMIGYRKEREALFK